MDNIFFSSLRTISKGTMASKGKILRVTKVSEWLQTRIPVEVAKILSIQVGDSVVWKLEGKNIVVEKA